MKISIAIPLYVKDSVGVEYLRQAFDTIEKQTFKDFEVVISDHSKITDTIDLCEEYCTKFKINYIKNFYGREIPHPGTVNSNVAIENCKGEYIKLLHCDDFFVDNFALEKIVKTLDETKKKWLVCGFNHTTDGINFFNSKKPQYPNHLLVGNNLLGAPTNITVRNDCQVYFDPDAMMSMDHEWYHRLRMEYGLPVFLDDILVTSRMRDDRLSALESSKFDIIVEGDGSSWQFISSELHYLQEKHSEFFNNWKYPDEN